MKILKYNFFFLILSIFFLAGSLSTKAQTLYWQKIATDVSVYDILYDGVQNLYFSGSSSGTYFWRSTDLGKTWAQLGNGSLRLYRLAIDSIGVLWGGNDNVGGIYKSTDQGDNWSTSLASNDRIFSLTVSSNNWIWAGTYDGKVVYSSNSGQTWEESNLANDIIWSIGSNSFNHIFSCSGDGEIFRTTNLGLSWELVNNSSPHIAIQGIVIDNFGNIYANKYTRRLLSTDNGSTWTEVSGPILDNLYLDKNHFFYGGSSIGAFRSTTDCITWQNIGLNWQRPNSFAFVDSLIFAGTSLGLFKYDPLYVPYLGDNYFPLKVGNTWQYFLECDNTFCDIDTVLVITDSIILNKQYFLLGRSLNDWVRYDNKGKIFYLRWNDSDYVFMNYTFNEGTEFEHMEFGTHQIHNATVIAPIQISIFDSNYFSKGFFYYVGSVQAGTGYEIYHSESLAETRLESASTGPGGSNVSCLRKLIRAIIIDTTGSKHFSDNKKPIINFQPILIIDNLNFELNLTVNHEYTYFGTYKKWNFVDSVLMHSYYSNGDSTILNLPFEAINEPNSINYNITYLLDSTLMKNDFSFYYKIYAVDKGIVPEHSTKPDTGYYKLVYDTSTVSAEEINSLKPGYSLGQNYPNPFNPTTAIEYSIEKEGNVELIIYDVLGKVVEKIVDERKTTGNYSIQFAALHLSSGIYFYSLRVNGFVYTKKMLLIK